MKKDNAYCVYPGECCGQDALRICRCRSDKCSYRCPSITTALKMNITRLWLVLTETAFACRNRRKNK